MIFKNPYDQAFFLYSVVIQLIVMQACLFLKLTEIQNGLCFHSNTMPNTEGGDGMYTINSDIKLFLSNNNNTYTH